MLGIDTEAIMRLLRRQAKALERMADAQEELVKLEKARTVLVDDEGTAAIRIFKVSYE